MKSVSYRFSFIYFHWKCNVHLNQIIINREKITSNQICRIVSLYWYHSLKSDLKAKQKRFLAAVQIQYNWCILFFDFRNFQIHYYGIHCMVSSTFCVGRSVGGMRGFHCVRKSISINLALKDFSLEKRMIFYLGGFRRVSFVPNSSVHFCGCMPRLLRKIMQYTIFSVRHAWVSRKWI